MKKLLWVVVVLALEVLLLSGYFALLSYAALVVLAFADLPTALVCQRGRTEVDATPHIKGGLFEERRVGPCILYNPESRPVPGLMSGRD
jgi:hypothetical protein